MRDPAQELPFGPEILNFNLAQYFFYQNNNLINFLSNNNIIKTNIYAEVDELKGDFFTNWVECNKWG